MENNDIGIYVHIPFCKQKCYYCDFTSFCNKDNLIDKYVQALKKEINSYEINLPISTVYIGGGTPSYIDEKYIQEILNEIKKSDMLKEAEITIEVNPGTVTKEKLEKYVEIGINRLSIGLQSTNDKLLEQIGRIHDYNQFMQTYNLARDVGFKNINVDLMIGLPNQTINDVKESLEKIIKLKPEHISVYSLMIEDDTVIAKKIEKGELQTLDEEIERNMYWYVKNTLELNNYIHYEISNFSKKGFESNHNMNCWKQKEYIGFGISAHSYINNIRYSNIDCIEKYIDNIEHEHFEKNRIIHEKQKVADTKKEYMLLGLRKIGGVKISDFKNKFGDNPIFIYRKQLSKLVDENLLVIDDNIIRLTNKGIDVANLVWKEFV